MDGLSCVLDLIEEENQRLSGKSKANEQNDKKVLICKYMHDSDHESWISIAHGDEVQVQGATVRAIHTPGHTTDHLCFHLLEDNTLLSGDHILGGSTTVFENLRTYMSSLKRILELGTKNIYPAHGLQIEDSRTVIQNYIDHRQAREDQVIKCMLPADDLETTKPKVVTTTELVAQIYRDVRKDLWPAAEHGLIQHLTKLKEEGKVEQLTSGWLLIQDEKDDRMRTKGHEETGVSRI